MIESGAHSGQELQEELQAYLMDLLGRMTAVDEPHTSSDDSISWHAHREAEALTDPAFLPLLKNIILAHPGKQHTALRRSGYFVLAKLLRWAPDPDYLAFFVEQLPREDNKYVLDQMLTQLTELSLPDQVTIDPIVARTQDQRWLVRWPAIGALRCSRLPLARQTALAFVALDDEKTWKVEITYAQAALSEIGTIEDIPAIERHSRSRIRDVKDSALWAIEKIRARAG